MKKTILTTLFALLIGTNFLRAQIIEQISIDGFFGISSLNATIVKGTELDFFNNYGYEEFIEDGYISGACHIWIKNGMEINMEAGFDALIFQLALYDFRLSTPISKQFKLNTGFENSVLIADNTSEYIQQLPEFQTHTIYQDKNSYSVRDYRRDHLWYGPYIGLNYSKTKNRWLIREDFNTGIFINYAHNYAITMKEKDSNAVKKQVYHLKSTASLWVKPEIYVAFAAINAPKYQIGLRANVELFLAAAGINYQLSEYDWTLDNPGITDMKLPKHLVCDMNVDFGIYFLLK